MLSLSPLLPQYPNLGGTSFTSALSRQYAPFALDEASTNVAGKTTAVSNFSLVINVIVTQNVLKLTGHNHVYTRPQDWPGRHKRVLGRLSCPVTRARQYWAANCPDRNRKHHRPEGSAVPRFCPAAKMHTAAKTMAAPSKNSLTYPGHTHHGRRLTPTEPCTNPTSVQEDTPASLT